jgi:cell division protein FtsI/penicillin-binding protein 2
VSRDSRSPARLAAACALIASVIVGVAARLCQLALVDGARLATLARRQHSETEQVTPLRGAILDRFGEPLAMSIRADSVFVRPAQLPDDGSGAAVARVLQIPRSRWVKKISTSEPFAWVKRQASPDERDLNVPGVGTIPERRRFYPHGRMAAAVVGFAGIDSQGLEGIELAYDGYLRGASAEVNVERDARGRRFLAAPRRKRPDKGRTSCSPSTRRFSTSPNVSSTVGSPRPAPRGASFSCSIPAAAKSSRSRRIPPSIPTSESASIPTCCETAPLPTRTSRAPP